MPFSFFSRRLLPAIFCWLTVWLLISAVSRAGEALKPIEVDIVTGTPVHLLLVGHEDQLGFQFKNPNAEARSFSFSAVMTSYDGASLQMDQKVTVKGGETLVVRSTAKPTERGHWYVDYKLVPEKGPKQADRMAFAYLQPAGPRQGPVDGFRFAINGGISGTQSLEDRDREVMIMSLCGIDTMRSCVQFGEAEPKKGVWDEAVLKRYDEALTYAGTKGVTAEFLLCYNAQWDAPPEALKSGNRLDWLFSAPKPDEWKKYVHEMVRRYGDRITYWEVWNEADLDVFWKGDEAQYLQILKASHEAIKEINPSLQVMSTGYATLLPHAARKYLHFMEDTATQGASDYDVLAFHQHGSFEDFKFVMDDPLQKIRDSLHPPKPLYLTETAYSRSEGDQLPVELLWEKLVYGWAKGAIAHTWYTLRAGTLDYTKKGHQWGLYTEDFYPTPTYVSFNTLITYLRGKHYDGSLDIGDGYYAYRFGSPTSTAIVTWATKDVAQALPVVIEVKGATKATLVDPMGNTREVPIENDQVVLRAYTTPSLLMLDGPNLQPKLLGKLVVVEPPSFAIPGAQIPLKVTLWNPSTEDLTFRLRSAFPSSTKPELLPPVTVSAGQSKDVTVAITAPSFSGKGFRRTLTGILGYDVPSRPWNDELNVTVKLGNKVAAGPIDGQAPDFVIDQYANIVNFNENAPQREKFTWQGPNDLSAKLWLRQTNDAIRLRAEVRDDVASQPYTKERLWDGDGIEFAFAVPGQPGFWYFVAAIHEGKAELHCMSHPTETADTTAQITMQASRNATSYLYDFTIPRSALGCEKGWSPAIGFNFVANDCDDNQHREGYLELTPGLARSTNPGLFIPIVFEREKTSGK